MSTKYLIILADAHPLFRRAMKKLVAEIPGLEVVGEAADCPELFELLEKFSPDLVLLDISIPHLRGMEATRKIKLKDPEVKVLIMIYDNNKEYLTKALSAGAEGVLPKQNAAAEFYPAMEKMRRGEKYASPWLIEKNSYHPTSVRKSGFWTIFVGLLLGIFTYG